MSLKAKIEAVIYASEEPVTLAQLVGLLGEEAQAELERDDLQQRLALSDAQADAEADARAEAEGEVAAVEAAALVADSPGETLVEFPAPAEFPAPVEYRELVPEDSADGAAEESSADAADAAPTSEEDAAAATAAAAKAEKARLARLRAHFRVVLDALVAEYATPERGLEIREVGGGFRLATKPEYHDAVRGFVKSLKPPLKLTLQALETLAVVAYKQPVTAPEISEIRGVDSAGVLGSLLARKLVTTAGRKQVIGRPILYKTTKEFLLKFGLKDVGELPSIEEFEKMAGQMAEQEEMAMEHETPDADENAQPNEDQLESDQEAAAPEPVADEVIVDGREAGLPPRYDDAADDPSAEEARIQEEEREK